MGYWTNAIKWLDRNTLLSGKKLLTFILGFLAAALPLATNLLTEPTTAIVFLAAFLILFLVVLVLVRPKPFTRLQFDQSRWGIFSVAMLGYGLGLLVNHNRPRFMWLWYEFRKIDKPDEWVLVSLFLVGVMLGFFVVRNFSKDQKDFVTSLTAVFGAAFVSTLLGQLNTQSGSVLLPATTFAFYTLGFTLSGSLNLIVFALLISRYSRTQSRTSRAVIDFLYGSEKAKEIDGYFLRNFEEDPNYAKVKLVNALNAYRDIIRKEFAEKMTEHKRRRESSVTLPTDIVSSPPHAGSVLEPLDYFELVSIESELAKMSALGASSPLSLSEDDTYDVIFRKLKEDEKFSPKMFRVAISMRWQDNLEYVVAPGEYKKDLPYYGSVAGLALEVRRTIVMERDKYRKFRTQAYLDGKTPSEIGQPRGLHNIDFLSYIAVPMTTSFGKQEEEGLGILHLDTKLFAYPSGLMTNRAVPLGNIDSSRDLYKLKLKRAELEKFTEETSNLYDLNDEKIEYLEQMRDVIVPLLELYKKCRTGARAPAATGAAAGT